MPIICSKSKIRVLSCFFSSRRLRRKIRGLSCDYSAMLWPMLLTSSQPHQPAAQKDFSSFSGRNMTIFKRTQMIGMSTEMIWECFRVFTANATLHLRTCWSFANLTKGLTGSPGVLVGPWRSNQIHCTAMWFCPQMGDTNIYGNCHNETDDKPWKLWVLPYFQTKPICLLRISQIFLRAVCVRRAMRRPRTYCMRLHSSEWYGSELWSNCRPPKRIIATCSVSNYPLYSTLVLCQRNFCWLKIGRISCCDAYS